LNSLAASQALAARAAARQSARSGTDGIGTS